MNMRNTGLSDHMIVYGLRPDYDAAAKRLLCHKIVLSRILKMCIPEFRDSRLSADEIARDYLSDGFSFDTCFPVDQEMPDADTRIQCSDTEDKTRTEGVVEFDVLFDVRIPGVGKPPEFMTVNIEFQGKQNIDYPLLNRAEYYLGRLISRQNGVVFKKSEYQNLRKVYSLWINMGRNRKNSCVEYPRIMANVKGTVTGNDFVSLGTIIVINLDENDEMIPDAIIKFLGTLFTGSKTVEERQKSVTE